MARPLRVAVEGGWYHAFARELNGVALYGDDRDREHFLELLESCVERYRLELHAYVLMSTHFHLVVCTPEANLSRAMQWLNLSFAAWVNARYDRTGPVFRRPFGSVLVENAEWAYELSLYVHLNPLRIKSLGLSKRDRKAAKSGMARRPSQEQITRRLERLREYRWSSYRAYAGYELAPKWLTTKELLSRAAERPKEQVKAYRAETQERLSGGGDPAKLEAIRDRIAVGSGAFIRQVRDRVAELGLGRETSGKRALRSRVTIHEVIGAVAEVRGVDRETVLTGRGDAGPTLAMWMARQCTGATLGEIGEGFGGKDYAAVAMAVKRLGVRLNGEPPAPQGSP